MFMRLIIVLNAYKSIAVQNLFNVARNETQFATASRLAGEAASVEEICFTPGTPFFIKGTIQFRF